MSHDLTLNWRFRIRIPIFLVKLFRPRPSKRGPKRSVFGGFGRGKKNQTLGFVSLAPPEENMLGLQCHFDTAMLFDRISVL